MSPEQLRQVFADLFKRHAKEIDWRIVELRDLMLINARHRAKRY
jgi:hypothetical protein